jgi:hypothetical protein
MELKASQSPKCIISARSAWNLNFGRKRVERGLQSCKRHNHQCWHLWRGLNFNLGGKCTYWWWLCRITVTDAGAISAFNNLASDGTTTLQKMPIGSSYGNQVSQALMQGRQCKQQFD